MKFEVWSLKFEVWCLKFEVWSLKIEDLKFRIKTSPPPTSTCKIHLKNNFHKKMKSFVQTWENEEYLSSWLFAQNGNWWRDNWFRVKTRHFFQNNNNNSTFEWARILFRILNYCLKNFFAIELEIWSYFLMFYLWLIFGFGQMIIFVDGRIVRYRISPVFFSNRLASSFRDIWIGWNDKRRRCLWPWNPLKNPPNEWTG